MSQVPLGHFRSFGRSFNSGTNLLNQFSVKGNPMGNPSMGSNPFPRQSLFQQFLSQRFGLGPTQGGNSQLFGPTGPTGPTGSTRPGTPFAPYNPMQLPQGNLPPGAGRGRFDNTLSIQGPGPMQGPGPAQAPRPQVPGPMQPYAPLQAPTPAPVQPQPQPQTPQQPQAQSKFSLPQLGGWIQDILGRLRIGK